VALAAALMSMSVVASAATEGHFDYGLRVTAGYSDNLYRVPSGASSEAFSSLGGTIDYRNVGRRVDADLLGDLGYFFYTGNASNELTGNFNGRVSLGIVPERILWVFEEAFSQGVSNGLQPATPGNTQSINNFSTGPDFIFRFGDSMSARLSGRYTNVWYQDTLGDNNRYKGELSLEHQLSARGSIGLVGNVESVKFTEPGVGPDYDKYEGYLTYRAEGVRTRLTLDAGYTEISGGNVIDNGPLVRLSIDRRVSPSSRVILRGGYEYNDSGSVVAARPPLGTGGNPGNLLSTPEPYQDSYGSLGWGFERVRTKLALEASYHDENYVATSLNDRTRLEFSGRASHDLNSQLALILSARYSKDDYQTLNADYDEWDLLATLSWRILRTVSLQFSVDHWDRSGSGVYGSANENRFWVGATWSPRAQDESLRIKDGEQLPTATAPKP
jgi:hypothetical protein